MEKFEVLNAIVAPMDRANVDTDAIIPSREMKRVSKLGLGEGLFAGWRYLELGGREPDPGFVLNQPGYEAASIVLSGPNFGCGSSREHAVWALKEFGIRTIIAPDFGSIFANNCVRNGLLPLVLDEAAIAKIARWVEDDPAAHRVLIDLPGRRVLVAVSGGVDSRSIWSTTFRKRESRSTIREIRAGLTSVARDWPFPLYCPGNSRRSSKRWWKKAIARWLA